MHHASRVTYHVSRVTYHASRITHHASRIMHHASRITHHASRITYHASRITYHASRITHHASRITHHVSRITQLLRSRHERRLGLPRQVLPEPGDLSVRRGGLVAGGAQAVPLAQELHKLHRGLAGGHLVVQVARDRHGQEIGSAGEDQQRRANLGGVVDRRVAQVLGRVGGGRAALQVGELRREA